MFWHLQELRATIAFESNAYILNLFDVTMKSQLLVFRIKEDKGHMAPVPDEDSAHGFCYTSL